MNVYSYKKLQEIAESKGKQLFIESYAVKIDKSTIDLQEKAEIVEQNGKSYTVKGTIKNLPVTTYEQNRNSRTYKRPVWEGVQKSKRFEGSLCMDSHVEDAKVADILGVWKNFKLGEKNAFGDLKLYGEDGAKVLALAEDTSMLGLSTVGFGEVDDDGIVLPESYEYVRTDIVLDPSQEVYIDLKKEATIEGTYNEIIEEKDDSKNSFSDTDTNLITDSSSTIEERNNKSTIRNEDKTMEKQLLESSIKNEARTLIGNIPNNPNLLESFSNLANFLKDVPDNMSDTKQDVRIAMADIKNKISEAMVAKDAKIKELEEKVETAASVNDELKEKYNKACTLIDSEAPLEESISANLEKVTKLEEEAKKKDETISALKENEEAMLDDIGKFKEAHEKNKDIAKELEESKAHFTEEITNRDEDIAIFISEREDMLDDIRIFKEERVDYMDDNKQMLAILKENEIEIKEFEKKEREPRRTPVRERRERNPHVDPHIKSLYERELDACPALADIEEEILSSKSLIEATNKIETFAKESTDDSAIKLEETTEKPMWLGNLE